MCVKYSVDSQRTSGILVELKQFGMCNQI